MIKKHGIWVVVLSLFIFQSCSLNTETMYYKDSATSMESNILMDQTAMGMMNMINMDENAKKASGFENITTDWQSLYDIQKNGKIVLNEKEAGALKKMFIKINKSKNETTGISLKYDKLLPAEIASLFASRKELKKIPLQDFAKWDGEKLEINTEKFNVAESLYQFQQLDDEKETLPKTKQDSIEAYGKQMASGMMGMMKMFNMNFTNTLKFQKPIKSIEGKHDFVEKIDDHTIRIKVRTADLWDEEKNLTNKDKKIIVTTK